MFRIKNIFFLFTAACIIQACTPEEIDLLDENEIYNFYDPSKAQIKFIHSFIPLTPNATASGPGFRIFANGKKIDGSTNTSVTANVLLYGGTFPASTAYSILDPGNYEFLFVINRVSGGNFVPVAGDTVFRQSVTLQAGKKYSFFLQDIQNPGVSFVVEDIFNTPPKNGFRVRFINLCADYNNRYDVYSVRNNGNIFTNVGFKEIKDYIVLGVPSVSDTFHLRLNGSQTNISSINTFSGTSQRVYTFYARGRTGMATPRNPGIAFYTNR